MACTLAFECDVEKRGMSAGPWTPLKWVRGIFGRQKNEEPGVLPGGAPPGNAEALFSPVERLPEKISDPAPPGARKVNGFPGTGNQQPITGSTVATGDDAAGDLDELADETELIEDADIGAGDTR